MLTGDRIVLYVEDEEGDRFFMQRAFRAAGLARSLQTASDGSVAIDYLSGAGAFSDRAQHPIPHLVLLDLNMPQVSGFEVLQWIRKHPAYATLPVVIFTSSSHAEDRDKASALGATDFWQKPGSGLQFSDVVATLCNNWPSLTSSLAEVSE